MGLDNYASRCEEEIVLTEADEEAFESAGLQLMGSIASGDAGSFRGKVYWSLVLEVTGESLSQPWIEPEVVGRMASALARHSPSELVAINERVAPLSPLSEQQAADLTTFFTICAERGIGLIGWT